MKKATRILALLLTLVMLFVLGACSNPGGDASDDPSDSTTSPVVTTNSPETQTSEPTDDGEQPQYGGIATIGWRNVPADLFFIKNHSFSIYYIAPVCETLARLVNGTNDWEPFLAESLTSDLDNNTFTIKLKEGIMFHDGSELTAEVVKWNFQFMIDNGQGSYLGNPVSFDATDTYTLVVSFAGPSVNWSELLGQIPLYSQLAYETNGLDYCLLHPVGTGPFVFSEYVADDHISYVRNDNYWQEGLPYLDGWNIQAIADPAAQMSAFTNGELDFIEVSNVPTAESMIAMGIEDKHESTFASYTAFGVYPNSKVEGDPWYDTAVRQAVLLYGIDWEAVAMLAGGERGIAHLQQCIEGALCYVDGMEDESYYDVDKAKAMLADAGYPDGFSTKIYSPMTTVGAATAVQDQLKNLNIEAEIVQVTPMDTARSDGTSSGLSMLMVTTAYDLVYKSYTMFFNKDSISYGANVMYSDEFNTAYENALAAKTWEERAEYGQMCARLLNVDECKLRMMYMQINAYFIQDYFHGSNYNFGNEIFNVTPDVAWLEQ